MVRSDSRREDGRANAARFFGVGFTFAFIVAIFAVGGYLLDRLFGTIPLFMLAGLVLGFAGAIYYVYLKVKDLGSG